MIKFLLIAFLLSSVTSRRIERRDLGDILDVVWNLLNDLRSTIPLPEDTGLNITQMLHKYSYPVEEHTVTTDDGYVLSLYRIPHGRNDFETLTSPKPPVFVMHGLFVTATDFCNTGPDKSLGMILADAGYDVWLGNSRGNTLSRKHVTLDPDRNASFWDFSFHEKGVYDLPAFIDYILNSTGYSTLSYVAHSEGTSALFAMGSEKPEYNAKLDIAVALAPIAYIGNATSPPTRFMVDQMTPLMTLLNLFGIHEIPTSPWIPLISTIMCNNVSEFQHYCVDIIETLVGSDIEQMDLDWLPVILSNTPAGASVRQIEHYGQMIKTGRFQRYDYGLTNLLHYGQVSPPAYDTHKISAPLAMFYSKNDAFASVGDVEQLISELPNVKEKYCIEYELFNHLDFMWAKDVKPLLYDKVVATLNKYSTKKDRNYWTIGQ